MKLPMFCRMARSVNSATAPQALKRSAPCSLKPIIIVPGSPAATAAPTLPACNANSHCVILVTGLLGPVLMLHRRCQVILRDHGARPARSSAKACHLQCHFPPIIAWQPCLAQCCQEHLMTRKACMLQDYELQPVCCMLAVNCSSPLQHDDSLCFVSICIAGLCKGRACAGTVLELPPLHSACRWESSQQSGLQACTGNCSKCNIVLSSCSR